MTRIFILQVPSENVTRKSQKSQKFWSSESKGKARFHFAESRQNKPMAKILVEDYF